MKNMNIYNYCIYNWASMQFAGQFHYAHDKLIKQNSNTVHATLGHGVERITVRYFTENFKTDHN